MFSRSTSPSLSSDNDSELSSSLNEDVPEISDGEFIPYDENLEPVATQEEAAAYEQNFAREEEERDMYTGCKCFQLHRGQSSAVVTKSIVFFTYFFQYLQNKMYSIGRKKHGNRM